MRKTITSDLIITHGVLSILAGIFLLSISINTYATAYTVEVYKSSQELVIKDGENIIKRFRIASGKGGSGTKRIFGDNKTPVGKYKIIELHENSRFHFFMQINYPNTVDAWNGYKNNLIDGQQFKEIVKAVTNNTLPPQDTPLGGYIGLHGLGDVPDEKSSIHAQNNWTEGCIALRNEEISELRQYISIGTTVFIKD